MFNKQLKRNIKKIDVKIGELMEELTTVENDDDREIAIIRIDELTKIRTQLSSNKVNESYSKEVVSGAIGLASMVLVLRYEKADIITSKAFDIAKSMIKRG